MGSVSLRKEARFPTVLSSDVAHSALSGAMGYRLRVSVLVGKISVLAPYVCRGVSTGSPNKGIAHPHWLGLSKRQGKSVGTFSYGMFRSDKACMHRMERLRLVWFSL